VKVEEVKVDEIERRSNIAVQEQEALRKEQELVATVIRPAEADKQRVIIDADAKRQAAIVQAEAERQAAILRAQGQRDARIAQAEADQAERERSGLGEGAHARSIGEGEAEAIKVKGLAEAEAVKARQIAEAVGMTQKAAAWREYGDAAVLHMLLQRYPDIVEAMTGPMQAIGTGLANVDRISVVDIGGGDDKAAPLGRLTQQIPAQVLAFNEQLKALFGVDIAEILVEKIKQQGSSPPPAGPPSASAPPPTAVAAPAREKETPSQP